MAEPSSLVVPLPRLGITLLPPWWAYILWGGKRIENRAPSVASRIGKWRGIFALGASKADTRRQREDAILDIEYVKAQSFHRWFGERPFKASDLWPYGGKIVGFAELTDIEGASTTKGMPEVPWGEPGQAWLRLGRVWEIEPVDCSGGRGMCAIGTCMHCGLIGSIENDISPNGKAPLHCRRCKDKPPTPREKLGRPTVKIVAQYGVFGRSEPLSHPSIFERA